MTKLKVLGLQCLQKYSKSMHSIHFIEPKHCSRQSLIFGHRLNKIVYVCSQPSECLVYCSYGSEILSEVFVCLFVEVSEGGMFWGFQPCNMSDLGDKNSLHSNSTILRAIVSLLVG